MKSEHQVQKGIEEADKEKKGVTRNRDGNHMNDLFEQAPIGIVECSLDGKYISVN